MRLDRGRGRRGELAVVAGLLALYWLMAVSVSPRLGVTADEVVHAVGGYSYLQFGDYRLHPENGTLPMRWAALPMLGLDLKFPPLDGFDWLHSNAHTTGREFFFGLGNPVDRMLLVGRAMIALTGGFLAWLTWRWARALFGRTAGFVALGLAAFCPTLLAHGGLITSDVALAACLLAALSAAWRLLHRVTWGGLALTTVAAAAAFLAKMSGVLIVPLFAGLLALRVARGSPLVVTLGGAARRVRGRGRVALAGFGALAAVGAGSIVLLWANYGFRYEAFNREVSRAESYHLPWAVLLDEVPMPVPDETPVDRLITAQRPLERTGMMRLIATLRDHRVLPEAYLWGFAHTYKFSRYRPAFFQGEYRATGWAAFFPTSFLLKTPLPTLVLIAAGALALLLGRGGRVRPCWLYRAAPLALFFVVYWAMALTMNLNIGHRHILPTYPVFFVIAGAAALWLVGPAARLLRIAGAAVLALAAVESLAARPFYLSYFQPLAGPGYRHFVDSSFDWGQGLPALKDWLARRERTGDTAPVFLTYFGVDSPAWRGLRVTRFGDEINDHGPRVFPAPVRGGWFVISATHFMRVYLPTRGPWGARHEALYQELRQRRAAAARGGPNVTARELMDLETLQFGRLCHALRDRAPDEIVGGSLLAFRLSDAEIDFALHAPLARIP